MVCQAIMSNNFYVGNCTYVREQSLNLKHKVYLVSQRNVSIGVTKDHVTAREINDRDKINNETLK